MTGTVHRPLELPVARTLSVTFRVKGPYGPTRDKGHYELGVDADNHHVRLTADPDVIGGLSHIRVRPSHLFAGNPARPIVAEVSDRCGARVGLGRVDVGW
jgi:hypothetical protein